MTYKLETLLSLNFFAPNKFRKKEIFNNFIFCSVLFCKQENSKKTFLYRKLNEFRKKEFLKVDKKAKETRNHFPEKGTILFKIVRRNKKASLKKFLLKN